MTAEYYLSLPADTQPWSMGHPSSMDFLNRQAALTVIRGHIDHYKPSADTDKEVSFMVNDNITGNSSTFTSSIQPDGSFEVTMPLSYDHGIMCSYANFPLLVEAGDTLDIYVDADKVTERQPSDFAYRSKKESAALSMLLMPILKRLHVESFTDKETFGHILDAIDSGVDGVMTYRDELVENLMQVCDKNYLDSVLNTTPLSPHGKQIMAVNARFFALQTLQELYFQYVRTAYKSEVDANGNWTSRPNSSYVPLDDKRYWGGLEAIHGLIYDCPQVIATAPDWVPLNRFHIMPMFAGYTFDNEQGGLDIGKLEEQNKAQYGIGRCFASQVTMVRELCGIMLSLQRRSDPDTDQEGNASPMARQLELLTSHVTQLLPTLTYPELGRRLMDMYQETVAKTAKTATNNTLPAEADRVLHKVIDAYRGNVLYLDFWDMTCGSCRMAMMQQRTMVEALKGQPVRFLYICDKKTSTPESAEKWMKSKGIKGEHIYVSHDDFTAFMKMFGFQGLPYAAIVNQAGEVVMQHVELNNKEQLTKYIR
ncbi:MAG: TlpA family protein disulfide reductase [Prevotella sp.]|nr:TlpA family protein disulfide reductase [Prevotella sp.]